MWESFFICVFIAFVWSVFALAPVQCRSPSGIPNALKFTAQMELCLRRCSLSFQANDAEISGEEVPEEHFCYAKCFGKEGKQHSLVNPQNTPSFKRMKRGVLSGEENKTSLAIHTNNTYAPDNKKNHSFINTTVIPNSEQIRPTFSDGYYYPDWLLKCLKGKPRVEKYFLVDDAKMKYEEFNNTGRYIATLSWTPFDTQLANWTGYGIIYALLDPATGDSSRVDGQCQEMDKNATNFTITNSSYGLANGSNMAILITSLPYPVEIPDVQFACDVPLPCLKYSDDESAYSTVVHMRPTKSTGGDKKGAVTIIAALSSTCGVVLIGLLLFRYRRRSVPSPSDLEFEYDAFIIYSSEDSQWVINTLVPTLEDNHGMKCCVHYRDFTPGVTFRQNMVDSVYKCKKVIAIVSNHFFKSKYCGSELDYALHRLMERRDDSLIVIKLDEVDRGKLPKELRKRSYIDYAKSFEKESWEKKLVNCLSSNLK